MGENGVMEYTTIANPKWIDTEHTMITIDIIFPSISASPVKFNASPKDVMPYGRDIYAALIAGQYGPIAEATV
jgi:hypothetical protein